MADEHDPVRADDNGLLNAPPGTTEFLHLVQALVPRPRRGERWLPSLEIGGPHARAVNDVLDSRLVTAARPAPYCAVPSAETETRDGHGQGPTDGTDRTAGTDQPAADTDVSGRRADREGIARSAEAAPAGHALDHQDVEALRVLLDEVCHGLARQRSGQPRLRFRHFSLVQWAMNTRLPPGARTDEYPAVLAAGLRAARRGADRPAADLTGLGGALDPVLQFLWNVLTVAVPPALFRVVAGGRVPGLGRTYRWFMRQPYLRPQLSGNFLGLAERLTAGYRADEPSEQVAKLLVHAFLEDLRRSFRRRPWRPGGWRHTAYPVVQIRSWESPTASRTLLRLVEQVRDETGRLVPVLLVHVAGRPDGGPVPSAPADALRMTDLHAIDRNQWAPVSYRSRLARRTSAPTARVRGRRRLWADGEADAERVPASAVVTAPAPPWFSRPVVIVTACLLLFVPGAVWSGRYLGIPGCLHRPFAADVVVRDVGGECIGFSDGAALTFNNQPGQENLHYIQERIFAQNRDARKAWEESGRRRPYVTVVYLGTLTGRATQAGEEAYAAEREGLEGIAAAQYIGVRATVNTSSVPLLRIVIANAGFQMKHADLAVDMIARLARQPSDAPVIGVVGPVESRTASAVALRHLNRVGLPAIAPALSADHIDSNSNLYFQISPPNRDQVHLLSAYARRKGWKGLHIYVTFGEKSSRKDDLYVATLLDDLKKEFKGTSDLTYTKWHPGRSMQHECDYRGMLFFAGRWSEYGDFLAGLRQACRNNDWPRHLVADDSVNRYMANKTLRKTAPDNLTMLYVSKSGLATCASLRRPDPDVGQFLAAVQAPDLLSPPRCVGGPGPQQWIGEQVGLAYDATMLFSQAVEQLAGRIRVWPQQWDGRMIDPAAVHTEILRGNAKGGWPGVTGHLSYDMGSGEPKNKPLSLLRVDDITDMDKLPTEVFVCNPQGAQGAAVCGSSEGR
ncbi:hypothetical protein ACWGDT_03845 [Streptomyces avermitilis]